MAFQKQTMIQRIQSVYLLLASIITVVGIWVFGLWIDENGSEYLAMDAFSGENTMLMAITCMFFVSALLTLVAIFQFKDRKKQFVIGRLAILDNLILLGFLIYVTQNLSGEIIVSEKGIGLLIPIINVLLVTLANKAIKKDEELVKSVDRLR